MQPSDFDNERAHRAELLASLRDLNPALTQVPSKAIHAIGMFAGGRGTYAPPIQDDSGAPPQRVVLSVLHTGKHYADELSEESLIYHFPVTRKPGYDRSDVAAGKAAMQLGLPIFVILSPIAKSPNREVRVGYVLDVDDQSQQFLIGFTSEPHVPPLCTPPPNDTAFVPTIGEVKKKRRSSIVRANDQPRFAFDVGKRYGPKCAFCHVRVPGLLDAAHIVGVARNGSDDPRNGLRLCKNHHSAFDAGLVTIAKDGASVVLSGGYTAEELAITETSVTTATGALPHIEAVRWRIELAAQKIPSVAGCDA